MRWANYHCSQFPVSSGNEGRGWPRSKLRINAGLLSFKYQSRLWSRNSIFSSSRPRPSLSTPLRCPAMFFEFAVHALEMSSDVLRVWSSRAFWSSPRGIEPSSNGSCPSHVMCVAGNILFLFFLYFKLKYKRKESNPGRRPVYYYLINKIHI